MPIADMVVGVKVTTKYCICVHFMDYKYHTISFRELQAFFDDLQSFVLRSRNNTFLHRPPERKALFRRPSDRPFMQSAQKAAAIFGWVFGTELTNITFDML